MTDSLPANICFVVGTLSQGGAERQLYYMLRALRGQGSSVTVLSLRRGEYWEERIKDLGVPVTWVGQHQSRPLRLWTILQEVRRLEPDIVQSSHFFTNLYAAVAARLCGVPAIGAMRNDCFSEVADVGLGKLHLTLPPLLAANSRLSMRNARSLGVPDARMFFLPNVVDCRTFTKADNPARCPLQIVTAGRLVPQKRIDRFVNLIARLRACLPHPVKGIVVGDGPLRERLQEQAAREALTEAAIEFRGLSPDMRKVYDEADLFVLTSDWEGTPNVVLEAMASGVPVVSTNVGSVSDLIVEGKTGRLVDPNDDDGLLRAVAELASSAERRRTLSEAARAFVESTHSPEQLPGRLAELYRIARTGLVR